MNSHIPVLLKESIDYLNIKENGIYVDCTLGRAGHSSEILSLLNGSGFLYSIDQDQASIAYSNEKLSQINNNFSIIEGNFLNITALLAIKKVKQVNGILYDLGVSLPQLDNAERGFSYQKNGPLDMRMDKTNPLTAKVVVNTYSEEELTNIIYKYGEEKFAPRVAASICARRPINTTFELVDAIKKALPNKVLSQPKHPAKKTFQAIRIVVNNELEVLRESLIQALALLASKGRICVITFHSLEEKVVKEVFNQATFSPIDEINKKLPINIADNKEFSLVIKKPIRPNSKEINFNNRSHSSKLFVIEKR